MAQVHVVSVKMVDIAGKSGNTVLYLPKTATLAQVQTFIDSFAAALDDVTAAKIVQASVNLALDLPAGLKTDAMGGQFIQLGANFAFQPADTQYGWTMRVPAIRESLKVGDAVDVTAGVGQVLSGVIVTGTTGATPTDENGADIVSVVDAKTTFRKK